MLYIRDALPGPGEFPSIPLITLFNVVLFLGLFFTIVATFTAIFAKLPRSPSWYLFMISIGIYCIANVLLVGYQTGPVPQFGRCLFQMAAVHAVPVFVSMTCLSMTCDVYLRVRSVTSENFSKRKPFVEGALHVIPLTVFLMVYIANLAIGAGNPQTVRRSPTGQFCNSVTVVPRVISGGLCFVIVIITVVIGIFAGRLYSRNWTMLRQMAITNRASRTVSFPIVIRLVCFTSGLFVVMILAGIISFVGNHAPDTKLVAQSGFNVVPASLPLIASIIFGSQQDIIMTLMPCLSSKKPRPENVVTPFQPQPQPPVELGLTDLKVDASEGEAYYKRYEIN